MTEPIYIPLRIARSALRFLFDAMSLKSIQDEFQRVSVPIGAYWLPEMRPGKKFVELHVKDQQKSQPDMLEELWTVEKYEVLVDMLANHFMPEQVAKMANFYLDHEELKRFLGLVVGIRYRLVEVDAGEEDRFRCSYCGHENIVEQGISKKS